MGPLHHFLEKTALHGGNNVILNNIKPNNKSDCKLDIFAVELISGLGTPNGCIWFLGWGVDYCNFLQAVR